MSKFLVDVNLPKYFSFFNQENFEFVADLDLSMSDEDIWEYAKKNSRVILTKDSDFYHKALATEANVKVVHFQLGNTTLQDLHQYFKQHWETIVSMLVEGQLILAEKEKISIIL